MRRKLVVLMVTAFVDMLGLIIVYPLLPFYATRMGASAMMVGALVASFSVAQLVSAPAWGWMSDRYGRRPVLLSGLGLFLTGSVLSAIAPTPLTLVLGRLIQAIGAGCAQRSCSRRGGRAAKVPASR